jgi:hypothetical protein
MYNINPLEIVVKEYCEGTDKHSYYKYREMFTDADGRYNNGPYIRFDWRNPNHLNNNNIDVRESMKDYYEIEREMGKQEFMKRFLKNPMGDKTISEMLVKNTVFDDIETVKEHIMKLYHTIRFHLTNVGITIKDVCFMISHEDDGKYYFWSEINQDCMRLVGKDHDKFDKDLWRAGGSSREEKLVAKWSVFNSIVGQYFTNNPYNVENYFEYDYYTSMCNVNITHKTNHADIYMKILSSFCRP